MNGHELKVLRKAHNMTLAQLANKLNYSIPYISYVENSYREVSKKLSTLVEYTFLEMEKEENKSKFYVNETKYESSNDWVQLNPSDIVHVEIQHTDEPNSTYAVKWNKKEDGNDNHN